MWATSAYTYYAILLFLSFFFHVWPPPLSLKDQATQWPYREQTERGRVCGLRRLILTPDFLSPHIKHTVNCLINSIRENRHTEAASGNLLCVTVSWKIFSYLVFKVEMNGSTERRASMDTLQVTVKDKRLFLISANQSLTGQETQAVRQVGHRPSKMFYLEVTLKVRHLKCWPSSSPPNKVFYLKVRARRLAIS